MAKLSTEEKKQAIEDFIATHQHRFVTFKNMLEKFNICSESALRAWVKDIYGSAPADFFISRGVVIDKDDT